MKEQEGEDKVFYFQFHILKHKHPASSLHLSQGKMKFSELQLNNLRVH